MKADTYDGLNTLNRGLADALEGLKKLQAEGVLGEEYVQRKEENAKSSARSEATIPRLSFYFVKYITIKVL